jgi:DNA modification methylase
MANICRRNPSVTKLSDAESRKLREQVTATAIELVAIDALKRNRRNAKQHPEQQVRLIAENIRKFGVNHPLLIDENNVLIGGHARLAAAELLKLATLPAIRLSNLSTQEKRAVALADNKLSELGSWDTEMLSLELKELTAEIGELTFDYSITGFDTAEIDQLLGGDPSLGKPDPADEIPPPADPGASVTKPGDLWVCGQHRLYCGDALDPDSYGALLRGDPADIVFTDPPYNVRVAGHVSQRSDAREFAMASGELSSEEFVDFLQTMSGHIAANVENGAVVYICMDWRHLDELSAATRRHFGKLKNLVVWVKTNGGQGSFYRSQHELIAVYVAGTAAPTNNFRLGERGRYRTNVWSYAGFNSFGRDRATALSVHPTMKPVAMVADALRDCSKRGEIVLDPFGGSGTTMIAAARCGRAARLIEIDPIYCDVIIRRWQTLSGETAVLSGSDETWAEVEAQCRPADGVKE